MKTMITLTAALILGIVFAAFANAADQPQLSPEQAAIVAAEAGLAAAKKAEALRVEAEKAARRAEWASLSMGEAWKRRGQSVVDAGQWTGGRVTQFVAKADATVGHYGVVVPAAYVTTTVDALAKGAKAYADDAFNNAPRQVAQAPATK